VKRQVYAFVGLVLGGLLIGPLVNLALSPPRADGVSWKLSFLYNADVA